MSLTAQTVTNYYEGILRQVPTAAQVASYQSLYQTTTTLTDALLGQANVQVDPVVRLYQAAFNRVPESDGLTFWVGQYTVNGGAQSLASMATGFSLSNEFQQAYGGFINATPPDYRAYVSALYVNVLGRQGEAGGVEYWTNQLTTGAKSVSTVLLEFSQSPEFTNTVGNAVDNYLTQCGQYQNGDIATPPYSGTIWDFGSFGATYTLTTGVDTFTGTQYNDTFNANFAVNPATGLYTLQTLNAADSLNGNGGTDTLNAQISADVTPLSLNNIEVVSVQAQTAASVLTLTNAPDVTSVINNSSTAALTVSAIAADATLTVQNTATASTFNYATVTGTQAASLAVNNVTGAASITIDGVETITTTANTVASTYALDADAATTLNFAGAANQTVTLGAGSVNVSLFDATDATGNVNLTVIDQSGVGTADVSILGGAGNDTLTLTAQNTNNNSVFGAAGDDTIVIDRFVDETVNGGTGVDTVSTTYAAAHAAAAATSHVSNVEELTLTTAATGTVTLSDIEAGLDQVNLTAAANTGATVTFDSGVNGTVTLSGAATLTGGLTIAHAGSGTTDAATIEVTAAADALNGQAITATSVETLTFLGASTTSTAQTIGAVGGTSGTTAVVFSGNDSITVAAVTGGSINATGLTGTSTLTQTAAAVGVTSITGSANADTLIGVAAAATTIYGGAGNDNITGGSAADALHGEAGDDVIVGGGGNDTITGGDGADTVTATSAGTVSIDGGAGNDTVNIGATLTSGDVINGGTGVNTLQESTALLSAYANVTNFQNLQLDAAITQNLALFTGNSGWTTVTALTGANEVDNAQAALATLVLDDTVDSFVLDRAAGVTTGAVTVQARQDENTSIATVTANEDVSIAFAAGAAAAGKTLTIAALDAVAATSITIGGVQNTSVTIDTSAADGGLGTSTHTVTVSASSATGTVVYDGTTGVAAVTQIITGSTTGASTLTAGAGNDTITLGTSATGNVANGLAGADTITGGTGNDSIDGGDDADVISGGGGVDTLVGGAGNDSITGGSSADSITGGTGLDTIYGAGGNDTITGGASADQIHVGTGTDRLIYSGNTDTQTGVVASGFVATGDIVYDLGNADTVSLAGVANLVLADGALSVGTSFSAGVANEVLFVSGSYNELTGIFTAGAASTTNNDYVLQYNGGTSTTTVNSVVLVDIVGTLTAASASEIITLTVA